MTRFFLRLSFILCTLLPVGLTGCIPSDIINPTTSAQSGTFPNGQRMTLPPVSLPEDYSGRLVYNYRGEPYVIDLDTGEHFRYTGGRVMINADWHPNGDSFACGQGSIHQVDFLTGAITDLTGGTRAAWSPDGTRLLVSQAHSTAIVSILDVTTQTVRHVGGTIPIIDADWSLDGEKIVYAVGGTGYGITGMQVLVVDASCLEENNCVPEQLTSVNDGIGDNQTPQWSPDGEQIVFVSNRDGYYAIYVMNADGTNQQRLTSNQPGDFEPTWSPDGQFIAFRRVTSQVATIFIIRPDGSDLTQLFEEPAWEPDWWMDINSGD